MVYDKMESGMAAKEVEKKARAQHATAEPETKIEEKFEVGVLDMGLIKTDPNKLYPLMYFALKVGRQQDCAHLECSKGMGRMDGRPARCVHAWCPLTVDEIKRSAQGKMATATQVSSAQSLKPLFKLLRSRVRPIQRHSQH